MTAAHIAAHTAAMTAPFMMALPHLPAAEVAGAGAVGGEGDKGGYLADEEGGGDVVNGLPRAVHSIFTLPRHQKRRILPAQALRETSIKVNCRLISKSLPCRLCWRPFSDSRNSRKGRSLPA